MFKDHGKLVHPILSMLLRAYLVAAAVFELLAIANAMRDGATRTSTILRELVGGGRTKEERRGIDALWIAFLWNLAISRFFLAYDLNNLPLFAIVVCIHVSEAILFIYAVPFLRWKQEYWVVPYSIFQATILLVSWLSSAWSS